MTQHQEDRLVQVLNQCCELMAAGESVSACLERFPEHAAALAPLLATASSLGTLRPVPARAETVALERRAQFMASAYETSRFVRNRPAGLLAILALWWNRHWSGLGAAFQPRGSPRAVPAGPLSVLVAVILFGALTTGAVTASATAIPGDALYPVKMMTERARVFLARSPLEREALEEQIASEHLQEVRAVVEQLRRVDQMPFAGIIEDIKAGEWTVSGLRILILPDTEIRGVPRIGAGVSGAVRAPGDGTLIAVHLAVEPQPAALVESTPTATPTPQPTSTSDPPTQAPSRTPTLTLEPTPTEVEPTLSPTWPPDTATPTTVAPTATRTRTPVPTRTVTPTRKPTATWTPNPTPPRTDLKKRITGWVKRIEGGRWTIGEITVDTDAETEYIGDPDVGSYVEASLLVRPDGSYLALLIKELGGPESTPEPYEFSGVVEAIDGDRWTVKGITFRTDGGTDIDDDIHVGDHVTVVAERRSGGEVWAKAIRKLAAEVRQFSGRVESINGDTWTVDSYTFKVTGDTEITGDPGIGDYVDVQALEYPDGRVEATSITRVPDTPTPTDEVPPTEIPTDTPTPPTPPPTDTLTPEPPPPSPEPSDTPASPTEPAPSDTPPSTTASRD